MKIAHLADVHLGYRVGQRVTPTGLNVREQDCAQAFGAAVDGVLEAPVDIVCIAGDLFHTPRPTNAAITFAFRQLRRLRDAGLPVVLVGGNHDQPKSTGLGSILHLFAELGVDVATNRVREFLYPALDLAVTAVPDRAVLEGLAPGDARYRLLVIHGAVEGTCPNVPGVVPRALAESEAWTYQAWGDYHLYHQIGPRAWYAGSTEYTSTNIWAELGTPKAWLLVDLDSGAVTPQPIPQARPIHDLEMLSATGLTAAAVSAQIAAAVDAIPGGITGAIVRLRVMDIPREIGRGLDHATIRKYKTAALHFLLDLRKPETRQVGLMARTASGRRKTVEELVIECLSSRELPPGMDRAELVRIGADLFNEDVYCGGTREERAAEVTG